MRVGELEASQVKERIFRLLDGYAMFTIPLLFTGVFRARRNPNDRAFTNASELWYPPRKVVRRGRFNEDGAPVFYACNQAHGAMYEIHPAPGDLVTVLIARTKSDKAETIQAAQIGLERCLAPGIEPFQRGHLPRSRPRFQRILEHHGVSKKWLAIDEYLSEMATARFPPEEQRDRYKITNAIGSLLLSAPGVDGLNYPSVATALKCVNICLPPDVADRLLVPSEAWMVRILHATDRLPGEAEPRGEWVYRVKFERRSEAIEADGTIKWSNAPIRADDLPVLVWSPIVNV